MCGARWIACDAVGCGGFAAKQGGFWTMKASQPTSSSTRCAIRAFLSQERLAAKCLQPTADGSPGVARC